MIRQNQIKHLNSLEQKKFRIKEIQIVLDGYRLIDEAINQKTIIFLKQLMTRDHRLLRLFLLQHLDARCPPSLC